MCINQIDAPTGVLHAINLDNISPKFDTFLLPFLLAYITHIFMKMEKR